ncbi:MAG: hypothetical protein OEX13_12095 [Gammaproteobacteria bacterium]|nr:hypothetical protein [Gammaproteobacteria bacterium]
MAMASAYPYNRAPFEPPRAYRRVAGVEARSVETSTVQRTALPA